MVTRASPRSVGKGRSAAAATREARFEPNTEAMLPGATGAPAAKLAPLTIAFNAGGSAPHTRKAALSHSVITHAVIPVIRVMVPLRISRRAPGIKSSFYAVGTARLAP